MGRLKGSFDFLQFEKKVFEGKFWFLSFWGKFCEGKFFGFLLGDWERGNFNTGSGSRAPLSLSVFFSSFCLPYNGNVGAGSGFSFSLL